MRVPRILGVIKRKWGPWQSRLFCDPIFFDARKLQAEWSQARFDPGTVQRV